MNCASIKSAKLKIDSSASKSPVRRKSFTLPAQIEVGLAAEHCKAAAASDISTDIGLIKNFAQASDFFNSCRLRSC
jgi:hypothetical protein